MAAGADVEPERLILDGQQRLTSLYQALLSGRPVDTHDGRGRRLRRWYYIDIRKALDPSADREEAIVGLPEDRRIKNFRGEILNDYSTRDLECQAELLPLPLMFDTVGLMSWQMEYFKTQPEERMHRWTEFLENVLQPFQQYQLPLIVLKKETAKGGDLPSL